MPFVRINLHAEELAHGIPRYTHCTVCHQPQERRRSEQSVCQACLGHYSNLPAPTKRPSYGSTR